jgi:hypothetical protein
MTRFATALALVLACSAVFGSAAASAAPATVKLTCAPLEPTAGDTVTCKVGLSTPDGPARGGIVRFEKEGFADRESTACKPIVIVAGESICVFRFKVTAPGTLLVAALYEDQAGERSLGIEEIRVAPGGSIRIECSPEFGITNEPSTCEAFVPNTPGVSAAPSGTVHFRAESLREEQAAQITPECSLEAVPGGARCAIDVVPRSIFRIAVVADYKGDPLHPAQFGSVVYMVFPHHQAAIGASCDPAPTTLAPITCTLTAVNMNGTGPAPTGRVDFEESPADGGFPLESCELKPVEEGPKASESSCQIRFQPRRVGRQVFILVYRGDARFEVAGSSIELEVIDPRITSMALTCLAQTSTAAGICLATVSDTSANPIAPTGTVKLNVPAGVNLNRETCDLSPGSTSGSSSCAFSYRMDAVGSAPVVAEYSGDPKTGHQPSSRQGVVSRRS